MKSAAIYLKRKPQQESEGDETNGSVTPKPRFLKQEATIHNMKTDHF